LVVVFVFFLEAERADTILASSGQRVEWVLWLVV
jgi:hypothetical protein